MAIDEYYKQNLNYIKVIDLAIHIAAKEKEPFIVQRFEGKVPAELNLHYKNCGYNTELCYDELNNKSELKVIIG